MIAHSKDLSSNHLYELAEWEREGARNEEKAKSFYEAAASKGHAGACYKLGLACQSKNKEEYVHWLTGTLIAKDEKKAFILYEVAAKNNVVRAQQTLSTMYATGQGVNKDMIKSKYWLDRVMSQIAE